MDCLSPPFAATPHQRQAPARASSDSRLCSLSVDVLHRVLDYLLLPELLALSRVSKRYRTLITHTRAVDLFLPDPYALAATSVPGAAATIREIHPVFGRLFFTPTNPVACVRIGSPRGPLLGRFDVRHAFATQPPVCRLTLRIVCNKASNGRKPWQGVCVVASPHGIRVWDLLEQLTLL